MAKRPEETKGRQGEVEFRGTEPAGVAERPPATTGRRLEGKRIAVIVADGFEQSEFEVPVRSFREAGAVVEVLAPDAKHLSHIEGESHGKPAAGTRADKVLSNVRPEDYDALLIPGGLKSPDTMRQSQAHLDFVKAFVAADKPIAAICHGPWLLADADALSGRTVTSWPAIRRDVERAGATWVDQPVVTDGMMVFSRKPADAEVFAETVIGKLAGVSAS
ncbi:putative cysteine protease YraA [compost metagenome]